MQSFRIPSLYFCKRIKIQTIMSKKQDLKRKAQLSVKARMESFRFQVTWEKNQKMPEIPDEALQVELDALCEKGLVEEIFTLRDIVEGARKELGYQTEAGKGSLEGMIIPFLLGITTTCPNLNRLNMSLTRVESIQLPLQVVLYYDNEIRNKVVDWVKARYENVTTRLGQPVLKRPNMVIEFKRVVKS